MLHQVDGSERVGGGHVWPCSLDSLNGNHGLAHVVPNHSSLSHGGGERAKLLDSRKPRVGDIYNPGHGWRLQIRDKNLRVLGYIESSGKITDRRRRKVGRIEALH